MGPVALAVEFLILFVMPPALIVSGILPKVAIIPVLWAVFGYSCVMLRRHKMPLLTTHIDRRLFAVMFWRFVILLLLLGLFTWQCYPELFLALFHDKPLLWLAIMLLYPLLSVIPQEILFRRFFFYRYEPFLQSKTVLLLANAALFSYVHISFGNVLAVALTFVGGWLFAATYDRSRSVLLVSIEHALYGNALYTLGLGVFFYHNGTM